MQGRLDDLRQDGTEGFQAMIALETAIANSTVPTSLLHLIKLRVSQINGCGFCVDMHAKEAEQHGESGQRLHTVATWWESPLFTEAEKAALGLAEAATRIADNPSGVPDNVFERARAHFSDQDMSTLIFAIAAINAWNRINVINRTVPGTFSR